MNILGLSFMYHDSAAALIVDDRLVAAAADERFSRKKHSLDFPTHAIAACLRLGGIDVRDLDAVIFYEKPLLKFERIIAMNALAFPGGFRVFRDSMPLWAKYKLFVREMIRKNMGWSGKIYFADHHYAHASSSFFASGFEEAAILTMDGVGEWATMTRGRGAGTHITLSDELRYPHSLGLLYSALTAFLGFRVNNGEGKVMGLASYGEPRMFDKLMKDVIDVREDGSFRLNLDYFAFHKEMIMYSPRFVAEFGPPRAPGSPITARDEDLAASLQKAVETVILKAADRLHKETGLRKLCIAGGVGLNSVTNGMILERLPYDELFVQPASGDDGGALGAALYLCHQIEKRPRRWKMEHAYLGTANDADEVERFLQRRGLPHRRYTDTKQLIDRAARDLQAGKIVGWVQGRMEYGPRALGARSILANPMLPDMKDVLNARVKHREPFRPFAPAVPIERVGEFFDPPFESPYMLLVARTRPEKAHLLPSITHVDGTARLQTVRRETHERYYDLIVRFGELTGVPVILNTSYNIRSEPIVADYGDAIIAFLNTDMDCLALEDCYLVKGDAPASNRPRPVLPPERW